MLIVKLIKKIAAMILAKRKKPKVSQEYVEFKLTKGGFASVFTLYNRYFVKSFFGLFFTFAFPVMILGILGAFTDIKIMLPGIVGMTAMSAGITGMPPTIIELKKSVLLKRIGASPVKPSTFTFVIIVYYFFLLFAAILWLLVWGLIFTQDTSIFGPLGTIVGFFGFLYGNLYNIILSISFGFLISAVVKDAQGAQAMGMLIYFPSAVLAGQFISPIEIADSSSMMWISRFIPFRYTTMYLGESWYGQGLTGSGNPFLIHDYIMPKSGNNDDFLKGLLNKGSVSDITKAIKAHLANPMIDAKSVAVWDKPDHIVGYIYPSVLIGVNSFVAIKKFSWSASR